MPSDRDRDRAPLRHVDREADDRNRRKERDRDSHRERDRDRDRREYERDRGRTDRDKEREKDRSNGASRDRARDGYRSREKDVDERPRSKSKEKDDRERDRERKRDRERDKERPKDREREKERQASRGDKRDREERDGGDRQHRGERDRREKRDGDRDGRRGDATARPARTNAREEKHHGKERKPELSEEERQVMERRARVEAWQSKKRALDEEKERAEEEAAANRKTWNLEDDASDDEAPAAKPGAGGVKDGEEDPLDKFMLDVGTKVQEDFATLDPEVAKDTFEMNEQLAKAGIKLQLPSVAKAEAQEDNQMDTKEPAVRSNPDEDMKVLGGVVAVESSPKQNVLASGLFDRKGISPIAVALKPEAHSSTVTLDQVAVKQEPGLGLGMPVQMNLGGAFGVLGGATAAGKALGIGRGNVVKKEVAFPAKKSLVPVKPNGVGGASEKRKAKLRVAAKKRRYESIQRAAPKALNPYGSDESGSEDDAGPGDDEEEEEEVEEEKELEDSEWAKAVQSGRISKGEKLVPLDHSTINYPPFRKAFYIESPDIAKMTTAEVAAVHAAMGGVKVRGRDTPKPIRNWAQCGLPVSIMQTLKRHSFRDPLPVQSLALPVVMSGRDCIGVATTGSGKTLAYVLPMMRNVNDAVVRGLDESLGNGPLGLIIAPTRELVQQISKEVRVFAKPLDLSVVAAYGGSGVKEQINGLKRGAHVVVCTPGRMIDILVTSNGSVTNLRRVQMLVIDEADRMFDMGFEPQISRIVGQVRPDRQTVLFSATFPRQVEVLARTILTDPIEVQVGGRSVVSTSIKQIIELRSNDEERFARLLEVLGEQVAAEDPGKTLIFVNSQVKCSTLFQELLNYGYPNQMLHGDMQQTDRESVISDFKTGVCSVLVATSVAARGLDVRELSLVINYDTPNHLEEYVHRCGRTGRAGNSGTALTFLSPQDDQYAPDLVKALRDSKAPVPADLEKLCKGFEAKRKQGKAVLHSSGYGGSGFRFDQHEDDVHLAIKMRHAVDLKNPAEDGEDTAGDAARAALNSLRERTEAHGDGEAARIAAKYCLTAEQPPECINISDDKRRDAQRIALQAANKLMGASRITENMGGGIRKVLPSGFHASSANNADAQAALIMAAQSAASKIAGSMGIRQSREHAMTMQAMQQAAAARPVAVASEHFEADLLINDFPQAARYHVTHRDTIANISERTGAAIIIRGQYYAPGQPVPDDDTKLYLLIEGPTLQVVKHAKALIKEIIEEKTEKSMRRDQGAMGRYQIA